MIILLTGGLITLIVLTFLASPFFRKDSDEAPADREVTIYKDQLEEVERDLARAVLTDDQARAAKTEIERRLLGALKRRDAEKEAQTSRLGRLAVVAALAAIPLCASLIYLTMGTPDGPSETRQVVSASQAQDRLAAEERHPDLPQQIANLEARLAEDRSNVDDFVLLARSHARLGNYEQALAAYEEVNRLIGGGDAQLAGEMAEVMVLANNGLVSPEAREIFRLIEDAFPDDPQSVYYLALAKSQDGDVEGGIADLISLREQSPPDAPWIPAVDGLLAQLSPDLELEVMKAERPRGPTAEQMRAAQDMTPEAQQQMIEGMVEGLSARLAENPDDLEGWRRLARAYEVMGREEDAANAHREVLARDPNDPAAKAFLEDR